MSKIIAILSAILLALAGIAVWPANQEPAITEESYEEIVEMTGTVLEITDTYSYREYRWPAGAGQPL